MRCLGPCRHGRNALENLGSCARSTIHDQASATAFVHIDQVVDPAGRYIERVTSRQGRQRAAVEELPGAVHHRMAVADLGMHDSTEEQGMRAGLESFADLDRSGFVIDSDEKNGHFFSHKRHKSAEVKIYLNT